MPPVHTGYPPGYATAGGKLAGIVLFGGFAVAIIAIFLFLARDIILRKKTSYDKAEFESKREKTFEKYHSDWGDDYEEMGKRKNTKEDKEFRDAAINDELPNYYEILGVSKDSKALLATAHFDCLIAFGRSNRIYGEQRCSSIYIRTVLDLLD